MNGTSTKYIPPSVSTSSIQLFRKLYRKQIQAPIFLITNVPQTISIQHLHFKNIGNPHVQYH